MESDTSGKLELDNYRSNHDYLNEDNSNFCKIGIMTIFIIELGFAIFLMHGQVRI